MNTVRVSRIGLAALLIVLAVAGAVIAVDAGDRAARTRVVAYFDNSNGVFAGDQVRILGVPVGEINTIEPQPDRVKISFWVHDKYPVPANANAVILSPSLVTARAIQLTPAYTGGPTLTDNAVIPLERTAVPVEWDDFRQQLQKLTEALQPTEPGGVSTLGAVITTAAHNLRGQGSNIRDTVTRLSQSISALGDHSKDIFGTVKNLSILVSALHDSDSVLRELNNNLAAVTGLLADDPDKIGQALDDLSTAVGDVKTFVADNRDSLGTSFDKLTSITTAVNDSLDDIEQTLHIGPTTFAGFLNAWEPAQGAFTALPVFNNFADPVGFICGAVQAASRLGAEQAAKLCVQYLAPIVKNRQYNFPPLGLNPVVGAMARPNELTYSEDWLRPDHVPPAPAEPPPPPAPADPGAPLPAEAVATDPAAGLPGLMVPPGAGS